MQLLLTRPLEASNRFAVQLRAAGVGLDPVISPILVISYREVEDHLLGPDHIAVFTSRHGILGSPQGQGQRAYVVGEATAKVAEDAGFEVCAKSENVDALFRRILADRTAGHSMDKLTHFRGSHAAGDLSARLQRHGVYLRQEVVYDQIPQTLTNQAKTLLRSDEPVILPLFSPRTASLMAAAYVGMRGAAPLLPVFISEAAAAKFGSVSRVQEDVVPNPTAPDMIAAVQRLIAAAQLLEGEFKQD